MVPSDRPAEPAAAAFPAKSPPIGIVFGSPLEAGCLEDRVGAAITIRGDGFLIREGGLGGRRIVATVAGHSAEQIERAVGAMVAGHRPGWILAAGFATALDDRLRHGEILLADSLVDERGVEQWREPLPELATTQAKMFVGRLLSCERLPEGPAEKRQSGDASGAAAVDRSSLAIARLFRREGAGENIRFLAVRVIEEEAAEPTPTELRRLIGRPTLVRRLGAMAGALVRHPALARDYWRQYERALSASAALARALAEIVPQLP